MAWIKSFGSKYHLAKGQLVPPMWSYCGVALIKDPEQAGFEPPEDKKCKRCMKLCEAKT